MMLEYVAESWPADGESDRPCIAGSGIAAYQNSRLVTYIKDITPNHDEAVKLAALLNRFEASLLHFRDIVEDYIAAR